MLHAINAEDGKEEWAFVPPFIAAIMPSIINPDLDGEGDVTYTADGKKNAKGGTNAIFGVDGSPVVHDMYFQSPLGTSKEWHTILFIPYGRGGNGFSVLDITDPESPLHLYSILNDTTLHKVHRGHLPLGNGVQ